MLVVSWRKAVMADHWLNLLLWAFLLLAIRTGESLRTGAPSLACINLRPLHGLHRAKPASSSQFFLSQSSYNYAPGQNITVDIVTHSSERYFRGFIIQAYDPTSGSQIGHFLSNQDARTMDSCSAATHRNNINKKTVSLVWLPPAFSSVGVDSDGSSAASQWFGIGGRSPIQPTLSMSVSSKRQLQQTPPDAANQTARASNGVVLKQVRFRATIVVTYEEFYTGFESSDQRFDRFDYANNTATIAS